MERGKHCPLSIFLKMLTASVKGCEMPEAASDIDTVDDLGRHAGCRLSN